MSVAAYCCNKVLQSVPISPPSPPPPPAPEVAVLAPPPPPLAPPPPTPTLLLAGPAPLSPDAFCSVALPPQSATAASATTPVTIIQR
ncbi:MAG TPA: hypothetical protein ENK23_06110 [Sorangium sp.]|nr:hypothetical protein [Sorangium sp.]